MDGGKMEEGTDKALPSLCMGLGEFTLSRYTVPGSSFPELTILFGRADAGGENPVEILIASLHYCMYGWYGLGRLIGIARTTLAAKPNELAWKRQRDCHLWRLSGAVPYWYQTSVGQMWRA